MIYYAKSYPIVETIKEHTEQLLERLNEFKDLYQSDLPLLTDRDWYLLEIAVKYHDLGKADLVFQKKIRNSLNSVGESIKVLVEHKIHHNFLSLMCLPFKELGLNREEAILVSQIVAYHHEHDYIPEAEEIKKVYEAHFINFKDEIEKELNLPIDNIARSSKLNRISKTNRIKPDHPEYHKYVLLKGLIHRLDHSASAHVPIDLASNMNTADAVNRFFSEKLLVSKNDLQKFAEKNQDAHLVVTAQTGMGKTEAGLLWLGGKKGFFTLPLRVSINAMYDRIIDSHNLAFTKRSETHGEEATGILHSTSLDYIYDRYEGEDEKLEKVHSQTKEFANKLIVSTIDQILKFPFYYLGFEKEYMTMATSKIIIDELQAYDPEIAALLIRAAKLIDEIGGSFMIMTATLPEYYLKALKRELDQSNKPLVINEFIDDNVKRHYVVVRNESLLSEDVIDEIREKGLEKKILVITNTVKKAQNVYEELKDEDLNVKLLHSRFTKADRANLEKNLLDFTNNDEAGVWVTTQLVEASLDIDFDFLYTEMSTLDSQFQRYGRCNRKGLKRIEEPNINVFTEEVSGVSKGKKSVYHYDIYEKSVEILSSHDGMLLESEKQEMIKKLYNEKSLEGTAFKKKFDDTLQELKNRTHYEIKKNEAQDLLRNIQQIEVVPVHFAEEEAFNDLIENWSRASTRMERRKIRNLIEGYSLSVNKWAVRNIVNQLEEFPDLYYIHCEYSTDKGLLIDSEIIFD